MQIEYDREVLLGKGGHGSVFLGKYGNRQVAIKRVSLHNVKSDIEEKALLQLDHPNIVKLFYSESDEHFRCFAMELCVASLDQLFLKSDHPRKYKGPALPPHLAVFLQLASGLEYIHCNGVFHRDIKPSNVLISIDPNSNEVTMKWADFGLSKFVHERGTCMLIGTEYYHAPELLRSQVKNEGPGRDTVTTIKSDVFSFALVIGCLLLDGQHLYGSDDDILINIMNKSPVNMGQIDPSHYARDLLTKMLENDPNKRISSEEVVNELESIKIEITKKEEEFRELCKNQNLDRNQIKLLILNGIDVNGTDNNGENSLNFLCIFNRSEKLIDAMQFLIQNGIDVNEKDNSSGWNALHLLCIFNHSSEKLINVVQFLIQNGIDVNEKTGRMVGGENAFQLLCQFTISKKIMEVLQLLIENGIQSNSRDPR